MTVLAYINTFKRYETTLPMCLLSVINQTHKPDKIIVFDDNKEPKDLRNDEHYLYLFKLADQKGIPLEVIFGEKKGAHFSHEKANLMGYDLAWFIDDDCVAEPTCLEKLMMEMKKGVGAVGGLILQPPAGMLPKEADNKIDDLTLPNIQWFKWYGKARDVEHIYSSFLYRCNIVHHDLRLSSVVFRGETMFTHSLYLMGYKLIVTPDAITWHFQSAGGIHSQQKIDNWNHDQWLFEQWLKFKKTGKKIYVLNGGLGDHYMFLQAIKPEPDDVIACCYPQALEGYKTISIEEAQHMVDIKDYDIYAWCTQNNWKGTLIEAYKKMYENLNIRQNS